MCFFLFIIIYLLHPPPPGKCQVIGKLDCYFVPINWIQRLGMASLSIVLSTTPEHTGTVTSVRYCEQCKMSLFRMWTSTFYGTSVSLKMGLVILLKFKKKNLLNHNFSFPKFTIYHTYTKRCMEILQWISLL